MKNIVDFSDKRQIINEAASWVLKLESDGGLSLAEEHQLRDWLDQKPTHHEHFRRLANNWNSANVLTELAVPIPHAARIFENPFGLKGSRQWVALAASFFFAIVIGGLFYIENRVPLQQNGIIATQIGDQKSITLADGSVMKLNTNTKVNVDYSEQYRNIFLLNGEAHFIVAKNKDRPFRVYASNGRIHAIGTAFSVYLNEGKVDVIVSEGRVGIASLATIDQSNSSQSSVSPIEVLERPVKSLGMIRAGEIGVIVSQRNGNENEIHMLEIIDQITDIDMANRISWTNGVLIFAGEPLEKVIKEIGRYTKVNIEFADPEIKQIRIGGTFPVGETEAMFSSLETSFGLRVTRLDSDHIVISDAKKIYN